MTDRLEFLLNGSAVAVDAEPDRALVLVLRNELDDQSPRVGCMLEQCGSCRVLVDGNPVFACTAQLESVRGRHVETAAGLDSAVVRALLTGNAAQCGYCLAGIGVAAEALFRSHQRAGTMPTRDDIVESLEPHLCRCGSQARILRLLEALAERP